MTKIAMVGCGYVADFYALTLKNHPNLKLEGVYDINIKRAQQFSEKYCTKCYESIESVLKDKSIDIVVNLTNPSSHYKISKLALYANKHVYSEKPLTTNFEQAKELIDIAEKRNLKIAAAPSSLLGETAQTLMSAVRNNVIGKVKLVYAEIDDGAIYQMEYKKWKNPSGINWPYLDEFKIGSTFEHAGYLLSWLTAFFGPVKKIYAYSTTIEDNKCPDLPKSEHGTDYSVANLVFENGVIARFTCGIVAPFNHSLKIIGDNGVLSTEECWDFEAPVYIQRRKMPKLNSKWESHYYLHDKVVYNSIKDPTFKKAYEDTHNMDFARGISELANSINESRSCLLSAKHTLHVAEIVVAIDNARKNDNFSVYVPETSFEPIELMPWAALNSDNYLINCI